MQTDRLIDHQLGLGHSAAGQLVALFGRRDVLHHHHEVVRLGVPSDVVYPRRADSHPVLQIAIEPDLSDVGVDGNRCRSTDLTLRRELADHGRRQRRLGVVPLEPETDVVADLAGADRLGVDGGHTTSLPDPGDMQH